MRVDEYLRKFWIIIAAIHKLQNFQSYFPSKETIILRMQRRSNSKSAAKQHYQESVHKSGSKRRKYSQANDRQAKFNQIQKRIKENLMFSLIEVFQQSRNQPSLIVPWMKDFNLLEQRIIGSSYMIVGPSQSGKYSAVKFALGENYPDVQEILINCDICTTEYQFIHRILMEFSQRAPKCKWPTQEKDINKLITNESIQFEKLNPFIEKGNLKFVIVIRNSEHLVGFKKQTILYNLSEWMRSQFIQERAGLVILTRNLMLIDRFEKRVRSRFQGNRLTIFRPTQAQVYIKIITKRIDAIIKDKQTWLKSQKYQSTAMQEENLFADSQEETNTRKKAKPKKGFKEQSSTGDFVKLRNQYKFVEEVCSYSEILASYLRSQNDESDQNHKIFYEELGLQDFFQNKIDEFNSSKNKQVMRLHSEQSILSVTEQLDCLKKIKMAIEKNKAMLNYFDEKLKQNQIITIPFVLRIFQHIFLTIEQSIVKELPVHNLQRLIQKLLEKNVQYEFPVNVIETNSLESLNDIELYLVVAIYKAIVMGDRNEAIKLTTIHNRHRVNLHKVIFKTKNKNDSQGTEEGSNKIPMRNIQLSIDRLFKSGIISYQPNNVWNSDISLQIELPKIRKGLEHLQKHKSLPDLIVNELHQIREFLNQREPLKPKVETKPDSNSKAIKTK